MPLIRRWSGVARAVALCAMLGAGAAHAQFANRSIGFSVGYIQLNDNVLNRGFPFGLVVTQYLEDGLEATLRVNGMIVTVNLTGTQAFAASGGLGVRYLFLQEEFRPYVGAELSYFQLLADSGDGNVLNYVGASPVVGFDLMLGPQFSVGPRAQVNVYWFLNRSLSVAYEATLEASAYF